MVDQIYDYYRQLGRLEVKLNERRDISKRNRELLRKFADFLLASGISKSKDLDKAKQDDLIKVVNEII